MLRDIEGGKDRQVDAIARITAQVAPDVILLLGVDYDLEALGLAALRRRMSEAGISYPYLLSRRPNTGMATGLDLDGDGRLGEPEDAQGYGDFAGQEGMAVLSRFPIRTDGIRDLSGVLWRDVPGALRTDDTGAPLYPDAVWEVLRLASVAQWQVPLDTPIGRLDLLALYAGPPVFDGPEDRNGRRNHDQLMFWLHFLDGVFGPAPLDRFVLIGGTNQDPVGGEGRKAAIRALLDDPRLQDPRPRRPDPEGRLTDAARLHTVDWPDPGPGTLRVDYILPSTDWRVVASGVHWPQSGAAAEDAALASRHRMVWMDLAR